MYTVVGSDLVMTHQATMSIACVMGKGSSISYIHNIIILIFMYFVLLQLFGHVVSGQQYVTEMENQKADANHRPYTDVRISNCGELVLMRSTSSSTNLSGLIVG